jgi:hypothetical protein
VLIKPVPPINNTFIAPFLLDRGRLNAQSVF